MLFSQIEYSSGQRVNLWYNIKPVHSSKRDSFGSQVSIIMLRGCMYMYAFGYIIDNLLSTVRHLQPPAL